MGYCKCGNNPYYERVLPTAYSNALSYEEAIQRLNLSVNTLNEAIQNMVNQAVLEYRGNWDNTKAYDKFDIVINDGTAYLAIKNVPAGTDLSDGTYWVVIGDVNITNSFDESFIIPCGLYGRRKAISDEHYLQGLFYDESANAFYILEKEFTNNTSAIIKIDATSGVTLNKVTGLALGVADSITMTLDRKYLIGVYSRVEGEPTQLFRVNAETLAYETNIAVNNATSGLTICTDFENSCYYMCCFRNSEVLYISKLDESYTLISEFSIKRLNDTYYQGCGVYKNRLYMLTRDPSMCVVIDLDTHRYVFKNLQNVQPWGTDEPEQISFKSDGTFFIGAGALYQEYDLYDHILTGNIEKGVDPSQIVYIFNSATETYVVPVSDSEVDTADYKADGRSDKPFTKVTEAIEWGQRRAVNDNYRERFKEININITNNDYSAGRLLAMRCPVGMLIKCNAADIDYIHISDSAHVTIRKANITGNSSHTGNVVELLRSEVNLYDCAFESAITGKIVSPKVLFSEGVYHIVRLNKINDTLPKVNCWNSIIYTANKYIFDEAHYDVNDCSVVLCASDSSVNYIG